MPRRDILETKDVRRREVREHVVSRTVADHGMQDDERFEYNLNGRCE